MGVGLQIGGAGPAEPDAVTPGSAFSLRDAREDDCDDIARLVYELAVYEKLADKAKGTAADFRKQFFGPRRHAYAMVAEIDRRIIGLAIWFYNFSTFAARPGLYVEDVFVEPAYRGLGIGRAFFRAMAQRAVAEGCARMEWAVLDWNAPAIAFYRTLGAVGMDEWTVQRLNADELRALAGEECERG
jgi:GNAT superfamily N-acetyltransferase